MNEKSYYCIYCLVLVNFVIYLMLKLEGNRDGQLSPAFILAGRCLDKNSTQIPPVSEIFGLMFSWSEEMSMCCPSSHPEITIIMIIFFTDLEHQTDDKADARTPRGSSGQVWGRAQPSLHISRG